MSTQTITIDGRHEITRINDIEVGQLVEISTDFDIWNGVRGTVESVVVEHLSGRIKAHLQPKEGRPDGRGLRLFWWSIDDLTPVEPEPEDSLPIVFDLAGIAALGVGACVRKIDDWNGNRRWTRAQNGKWAFSLGDRSRAGSGTFGDDIFHGVFEVLDEGAPLVGEDGGTWVLDKVGLAALGHGARITRPARVGETGDVAPVFIKTLDGRYDQIAPARWSSAAPLDAIVMNYGPYEVLYEGASVLVPSGEEYTYVDTIAGLDALPSGSVIKRGDQYATRYVKLGRYFHRSGEAATGEPRFTSSAMLDGVLTGVAPLIVEFLPAD